MLDLTNFYIDGKWVSPVKSNSSIVTSPADEAEVARISLGSSIDVDLAVDAARHAFNNFSQSSVDERIELLQKLLDIYLERYEEMAQAISLEMGAPIVFSRSNQAACGSGHLRSAIDALKDYSFDQPMKSGHVYREPIGVCGLITPWNWPINQIACKVAPALATGCTVVLKASELAPLSSHLFAEMIDQAGYSAGVFNLVDGLGQEVGAAISSHPGIDMVSFTGSTEAGVAVSRAASETVKRVCLELGGKSPNIILDHSNFKKAVEDGVNSCFRNTGQSCNAPTRMLVPSSRYEEAIEIAKDYASNITVGNPQSSETDIGPLVSEMHFHRVQNYIKIGIEEGARVVFGGPGKPNGMEEGYYTKPTLFADLDQSMRIVQEEIFGPVLCLQSFDTIEDVVSMANDSPFGLAAYVSGSSEDAHAIAHKLRAGMIGINGDSQGFDCPFGGYKQSGNGREWGEFGFEDYLEIKTIAG
ncbi:MAG: aldehyde dehydrogenase family protein [Gammaproteobacteria bacterium]|nr:aldehyde dehydrogenase family protein [Gammaproteobacteria bacterium]